MSLLSCWQFQTSFFSAISFKIVSTISVTAYINKKTYTFPILSSFRQNTTFPLTSTLKSATTRRLSKNSTFFSYIPYIITYLKICVKLLVYFLQFSSFLLIFSLTKPQKHRLFSSFFNLLIPHLPPHHIQPFLFSSAFSDISCHKTLYRL